MILAILQAKCYVISAFGTRFRTEIFSDLALLFLILSSSYSLPRIDVRGKQNATDL